MSCEEAFLVCTVDGWICQERRAAGEGDLYPPFGTTMEWDTAAGQAVLEAAGGRVKTLAGAPLTYGKPGFKNDGFIAWGRRA